MDVPSLASSLITIRIGLLCFSYYLAYFSTCFPYDVIKEYSVCMLLVGVTQCVSVIASDNIHPTVLHETLGLIMSLSFVSSRSEH